MWVLFMYFTQLKLRSCTEDVKTARQSDTQEVFLFFNILQNGYSKSTLPGCVLVVSFSIHCLKIVVHNIRLRFTIQYYKAKILKK